jgi:hypothetical protein
MGFKVVQELHQTQFTLGDKITASKDLLYSRHVSKVLEFTRLTL